jgi:hypothetical protein
MLIPRAIPKILRNRSTQAPSSADPSGLETPPSVANPAVPQRATSAIASRGHALTASTLLCYAPPLASHCLLGSAGRPPPPRSTNTLVASAALAGSPRSAAAPCVKGPASICRCWLEGKLYGIHRTWGSGEKAEQSDQSVLAFPTRPTTSPDMSPRTLDDGVGGGAAGRSNGAGREPEAHSPRRGGCPRRRSRDGGVDMAPENPRWTVLQKVRPKLRGFI